MCNRMIDDLMLHTHTKKNTRTLYGTVYKVNHLHEMYDYEAIEKLKVLRYRRFQLTQF